MPAEPPPEASAAPAAEGAAFETLVSEFDYPMFVVTTRGGATMAGCLVGFATQVSIRPRRFLVGLSDKNHTFRIASLGERLTVHVLERTEIDLARLFGERTGDDVDKFAHCDWEAGPGEVAVLRRAAGWFSGPILDRIRLGDHVAHLIAPDSGENRRPGASLLSFDDVQDFEPGHEA
ncbi:MAG TPA: flavin reductase family protein [Jatrophihabitans sp.]|jgi:flavin reductase (DIM6/NTAB) family NADH-FMN oxidoreductase RutF|nr:flavin reductase family protein [Jatrophihabitans sp.]